MKPAVWIAAAALTAYAAGATWKALEFRWEAETLKARAEALEQAVGERDRAIAEAEKTAEAKREILKNARQTDGGFLDMPLPGSVRGMFRKD